MSNMTTRLSDTQLAEIAKQRYETQQRNQIPGVVVDLPSRGLVYPKSSVLREGCLEMRHMTAYDEDILTNKNYIQHNILFEKLIESVITTPGFNVNELIEADKEWLIVMIRSISYGQTYDVQVTTPSNETITATVNLANLQFKPFDLISDDNGLFEYKTDKQDVLKFKFLSANTMKSLPDDRAVTFILNNSIFQVNDITDKNKISNWIQYKFLREDSSKFRKYMQLNAPEVDLSYEFNHINTQGKQETFRARFPIRSDFFWL